MWPQHTRGWRQRWRGFRDPVGDRIIAETVSGLRSEGLIVTPTLVYDQGGIAALVDGLREVTDLAHPALRPPRELQQATDPGGRPVVVSDYTSGTRLSVWLTDCGGTPPSTGTVLHIAQQVASALRALADHADGLFHGAVGLDRVLLTTDGRVLLVEAGLGKLLASRPERSPEEWWADYRIAVPFSPQVTAFGSATDGCQLGVLVLELLLCRRLSSVEYPNGLALLLGTAEETDLVGDRAPLSAPLFEWLSLALGLECDRGAPSIHAVADALDLLLSDDGVYVAEPGSEIVPEALELWPFAESVAVSVSSDVRTLVPNHAPMPTPRDVPSTWEPEHRRPEYRPISR